MPSPDCARLRLGSLCTGYGGLDLAAGGVFDVEPVWHAEIDPDAAKVLAHRFPGVPNLGDITAVDWTAVPPVDVLAAGYPCQTESTAGHRKGAEDERWIWPHVAAAVRALRPRVVLLENVEGHLSLGFPTVLGDLAASRFDAEWLVLAASEVGAAHRRRRVFVLARPADAAGDGRGQGALPVLPRAQQGRPGHPPGPHRGSAEPVFDWGQYAGRIARHERLTGRAAPYPFEPGPSAPRHTARFTEWFMGLPDGWVTDVPGLTRAAQLRILGNGVVPAQGEAAVRELTRRASAHAHQERSDPPMPPTRPDTPTGLPASHVMPTGYELRDGAVFHVVPRTDREGNPIEPQLTRVTYGPLFVARMCASHEGEQWFDLQWRDAHRLVTRRVDGAVLRSGRTLVRELGTAGIPVVEADAKPVERYLAAYLVANRDALEDTRATIARHLGWQDDGTFVTSDGAPWPVEPGEPEQRSALGAHRPRGTLAAWQNAVARVERYPAVRLALAAAFAPALLRIVGERSFTLDISGRSTRGKSTAAALALSAWADPTGQGEGMATWKSGIIMIEKRLNLVRGLPVVLDETRVVKSPEIVDQVLYQVPMNHGAARGGGWANMLPWHTIVISTGEQPALSFTSHEGAAARVLSLRRAPFGTDGPRSAADAQAVTEAIAQHHGTAGPAYAQRLCAILAEPDGAARLRKRHGELRDQHAESARGDVARRRAPLTAALHLAAQLAYEWDIVPLPAPELPVWADHFSDEASREDRGTMALDVVRGLIAAQGHRLASHALQGAAATEAPAGGWIGTHTELDGAPAVALIPEALAAALAHATPPIVLDAVREAWIERGTIPMDPREPRKLYRVRVNGSRTRCYVFAQHVLDGEELPDGSTDAAEALDDTGPHYEQGALGSNGWPLGSYGDLDSR